MNEDKNEIEEPQQDTETAALIKAQAAKKLADEKAVTAAES